MRQGDYITDRDSAIDFYSLRPPFLDCLSAGSSFTPLVFELKITPEQSKTMISQYITTPLKTEQAKLQQNKIESVFFFSFFSFSSSYMSQWDTKVISLFFCHDTQFWSCLCHTIRSIVLYVCHVFHQQPSHMAGKHYVTARDVYLTADDVKKWLTVWRCLPLWSRCPLAVQEGT